MFFSYSSSMKSQSCPTIKRWDLVVVMCWMLGTISINSSFCRPLDNWVQGIIESLHRQFHHLFQGVVVCAFILVAHRLKRGEEVGSKIKHQMHTPLPCIDQLTAAHPRFQTNVNRLPIYCHRDGFTITEVHAFDSKHVPEIRTQKCSQRCLKREKLNLDILILQSYLSVYIQCYVIDLWQNSLQHDLYSALEDLHVHRGTLGLHDYEWDRKWSMISWNFAVTQVNCCLLISSKTTDKQLMCSKLTFLSFWVWLDLQNHSGDGVSIHVIERISDPLKQVIRGK